MPRKILNVVGARPNFMKIAPLLAAFDRRPADLDPILVHTGQHYDPSMSDAFFEQLGLPEPSIHLGVGAGSHAAQTAAIMVGLERVVSDLRPDLVLVVGDVNSTLAAAVVAAKAGVPIAHVEAGLRSFDRNMPEEVNRVVTDVLASYLFATEESAVANLLREGMERERIFLVGNVMIDTLLHLLPAVRERRMTAELGLEVGGYGVVTLHRPSNVDEPERLGRLLDALTTIGARLPLVFPVHPRTAARLRDLGFDDTAGREIHLLEPLPYVEFISLVADARLVLTDSGGIQEETTILGVPCLTLREHTERPVTVTLGSNVLVGTEPSDAIAAAWRVLDGKFRKGTTPPLWDGHAADRIVGILAEREWSAPQRNHPAAASSA